MVEQISSPEIFVNNATYSEFPAYHIIIPGMSEINTKENWKIIERGINYDKVCKIVQYKLKSISKEEAEFVIKYICNSNLENNMQLKNLLYDIRVKDECIYGMVTIDLFLCLLYLKVQDYEKAAKSLSDYNKGLDKNNENSRYYFCFELFLCLIASGVEKERGITYMTKFYDETIVQMVVDDFDHNPFEHFEPLLCKKNCVSCSHQGYCITKTEKKMYSKIKGSLKNGN